MTTLENAAAVLKLFQQKGVTRGHLGLTFTDVVEALRLPKSTVSRLLATMEGQGMLERDPDSRCFHIGRVLLSVAGHYLSAPLVDSASPAMARLADKTGCIGYISRLDGYDLIVMRMFHGRQFTQLVTPPGSRMPAACCWRSSVKKRYVSASRTAGRLYRLIRHKRWMRSARG